MRQKRRNFIYIVIECRNDNLNQIINIRDLYSKGRSLNDFKIEINESNIQESNPYVKENTSSLQRTAG
jgi:hypothetical protein